MIFTLICRSLIIYTVVLFLIRVMGKRQIGEMQPFELCITLIIADLATLPMSETTLPLIQGIIPLLALVIIHYFLSFLSRKSLKIRKILNGRPVIVINPEGIDYQALKNSNMNFNDLQEGLRGSGYFNLDEILYAILQTNGLFTILPRANFAPLTANDLKIEKDQSSLPIIVFSEGKINKENAKLLNVDEKILQQQIDKENIKLKDVILITLNDQGKMYVQPKEKPFISLETNLGGS